MRVSFVHFALFSILFALLGVSAQAHTGYLSDIKSERESRFYEVIFYAAPPQKSKQLNEIIFNEALSKEFKDKYRERFGGLDTESIVYQRTSFSLLDDNRGALPQIERDQEKRQAFAEYMMKRLIEWHVDNYFKTEPSMRPVYELKEKLSNVQVEVNKETKFNLRYNFSDNSADVICENPYVDSRLSLMMDPKRFGPGPLEEEKLFIEKQLNRKVRVNTTATNTDGIATLEFVRYLGSNWSTNFLTSAPYKSGGTSVRESRYLVGLSHAY